jgi:2-oxo-4-hydroxy-4-carboxy-5-ureidoimidazoline decarboxylase
MTLAELNALPAPQAQAALRQCCGSQAWVQRMIALRPFATTDDVLRAAQETAAALTAADWLEAFAAHPRIGERSASAWSQAEQAAALNAEQSVQAQLAQANAAYEQKFGFIFIVFASGKTPEQILRILRARMPNDRETEIRKAAAEQQQITRNRLHKLLEL